MGDFIFQINYDEASCTAMRYIGAQEEVVIPDSAFGHPVTILYDSLFAGQEQIRSVTIPAAVTDIGEFVFEGCSALRKIELPASLSVLWGYSFCRCGLEEIVLPDFLRIIPPYAFKDCKRLRRVVCGAGLQRISPWAFGGCDALEELVCGPKVQISPQAFSKNEQILQISYS